MANLHKSYFRVKSNNNKINCTFRFLLGTQQKVKNEVPIDFHF